MDEYVFNILVKAVENSEVFRQLQENAQKTAAKMQESFNTSFKNMNDNAKKVAKEIGDSFKENLNKMGVQAKDTSNKVSEDVKKIGTTAKDTSEQMEGVFSSTFMKMGDIFKALVLFRISRYVLDMFTDIIQNSIQFERDLKTILAVSGAKEGSNYGELQKSILEGTENVPFSIFKITESMETLVKAGYNTSEALKILKASSNLAVGANEDLAKTVMLTTDIMTAYNIPIEDVSGTVDLLAKASVDSKLGIENMQKALRQAAPAAATVGISLGDTLAILEALAQFGIREGKAGSTVKQFIQGLLDVTPEAQRRLNELGISAQFMQEHINEPIILMQKLAEGTFSTQDAVIIFGKHFGATISTLVDQLREAVKNVRNFREAHDEATGSSERMAVVVKDSTSVAVAELGKEWEKASISAGNANKGMIEGVINLTTEILKAGNGLDGMLTQIYNQFLQDRAEADNLIDAFIRIYFLSDEHGKRMLDTARARLKVQEALTAEVELEVRVNNSLVELRKRLAAHEENQMLLKQERLEKYKAQRKKEEDDEIRFILSRYKEKRAELDRLAKVYDADTPEVMAGATFFPVTDKGEMEAMKDYIDIHSESLVTAAENWKELQRISNETGIGMMDLVEQVRDGFSQMGISVEDSVKKMSIGLNALKSVLFGVGAGISAFFQTLVTDADNAGKAFAAAFTGTIGQALVSAGMAYMISLNPIAVAQGAAMVAAGGTLIGLSTLMRSGVGSLSASDAAGAGKQDSPRSSRSFEVTGVARGEEGARSIVINVNTERPLATQREITESVLEALRYGKSHGMRAT